MSKKVWEFTDTDLMTFLMQQEFGNVSGILRIGTAGAATKAAITVATHGKEVTSGLPAVRWLLEHQARIKDLDLFVVIANERAANLALCASGDEWKNFRFTPGGSDMNRCPVSPSDCSYDTYEGNRAFRLAHSLGGQLDHILDLHSTDGPSDPAGLGIFGTDAQVDAIFSVLPVTSVYTGIGAVQGKMGTKTQPFSGFLIPRRTAIEVELGQTGSREAAELAPIVVQKWLAHLGSLDFALESKPKPTKRAAWSIMAPSTDWRVDNERLLEQYAQVKKGDVLLVKGLDVIRAPDDGLLVWGPDALELTASDIMSEIWFALKDA